MCSTTICLFFFQIQITTLSVSISLSSTVILVCLFTPKMYIIVFHPAKNVRKLTMNSTSTKKSQLTTSSVLNSNYGKYIDYVHVKFKLKVRFSRTYRQTGKTKISCMCIVTRPLVKFLLLPTL